MKIKKVDNWDLIITPNRGYFEFHFNEIWNFRNLLLIFIRRDIITQYKQTILGPLWIVIPPILTTLVFTIIFGNIAGISTDGIPSVLFYMAGIINWNFFSTALTSTSNTLAGNVGIFGKAYFPRIIVPLSTIASSFLRYFIQFGIFLFILTYFSFFKSANFAIQYQLLWVLPMLIFIMAIMGLGFGLLFSASTAKYKDLRFLIGFGVRLMMYASTVIFPLSIIPEKYKWIILGNPMSSIIESFRYVFFGMGVLDFKYLGYSFLIALSIFFLGYIFFNKVEQKFIDYA